MDRQPAASCLHAAEALAHGQLVVDPGLAEAITEPAQELRKAINAAGLPAHAVLAQPGRAVRDGRWA